DGLVVNLSYWIFPALAACQRVDPDPIWASVGHTGQALMAKAHFGRWGLPPDWLDLGPPLRPAPGFKPRFGYDAVRIPLNLMWGRCPASALAPFRGYWGYFVTAPFLPAWTDLTDDAVESYDASVGIHAVVAATMAYGADHAAVLPSWHEPMDYYSASLLLLTQAMASDLAGGA
ncbi:MAG: glycosyl hydrolase family 5, partial [Cyanobacteria bacterium REEB65]|nr:glycosyl hydrolase family 5 [Cyanobacteria bacterium REEB65]